MTPLVHQRKLYIYIYIFIMFFMLGYLGIVLVGHLPYVNYL
jgi:hypothetical protein